MTTKCCKDCLKDKPLTEFTMAGGSPRYPKQYPNTYCKACVVVRTRKYTQGLPPEERKKRRRAVYQKNKKAHQARAKRCRQTEKSRVWFRNRARREYQTNPAKRMANRLRHRLRMSIKGGHKTASTLALLGCTVEDFVRHLESLFQPGMTWENYGVYRVGGPMTWHIDHIRPCASFDLINPEEQRKCFHWRNMQPLWAVDNLAKKDHYEEGLL